MWGCSLTINACHSHANFAWTSTVLSLVGVKKIMIFFVNMSFHLTLMVQFNFCTLFEFCDILWNYIARIWDSLHTPIGVKSWTPSTLYMCKWEREGAYYPTILVIEGCVGPLHPRSNCFGTCLPIGSRRVCMISVTVSCFKFHKEKLKTHNITM